MKRGGHSNGLHGALPPINTFSIARRKLQKGQGNDTQGKPMGGMSTDGRTPRRPDNQCDVGSGLSPGTKRKGHNGKAGEI
jgi:hypothetical protein